LITRQQLPPPQASAVYELTGRGRALEPAIVELVRWAAPEVARAGRERRRLAPLRSSWLALALKAFFDPARAKRAQGHVVLELPTGRLSVEVKGGEASFHDASLHERPDVSLRCSEEQVLALVLGGTSVADLAKQPGVVLQGDAKALGRVLGAFQRDFSASPLPDPLPSGRGESSSSLCLERTGEQVDGAAQLGLVEAREHEPQRPRLATVEGVAAA
jgi:hypothetical protein